MPDGRNQMPKGSPREQSLLTREKLPNKDLELPASSVRSCLAPASGSSSCLVIGAHFT